LFFKVAQQKGAIPVSHWTRQRGPYTLVYASPPMDLSAARRWENFLKRQKGSEGFYRATGLKRASAGS
jgi:putative endonuclease